MTCKYCGQMIEDNVSFCPHCGKDLNEAPAVEATHTYESVPTFVAEPANEVPAGEQKSKIVAGILGILLGGLGIHNFYLGYTKKAVIQLVISLAGSCVVIGPTVAGIWGLVEGIMILVGKINVDGKGVPLKD